MDNLGCLVWPVIAKSKFKILGMIPAAHLQSPEWVAEHTLGMREANLSSSAKTEPGWKQRLKTLAQLAFSFFAGSGKGA